jgi:hypothetical protein
VAKTGSDANSCDAAKRPSTPKVTIQAGVNCLAVGDGVWIFSGEYVEQVRITNRKLVGSSWNPGGFTVIWSDQKHGAIIRPGKYPSLEIVGDSICATTSDPKYILVDGLKFIGNGLDNSGGGAISIHRGTKHIKLIDIHVQDYRGMVNTVSAFSACNDAAGKEINEVLYLDVLRFTGFNLIGSNNLSSGGFNGVFYVSGGSATLRHSHIQQTWGAIVGHWERADDPAHPSVIEWNVFHDSQEGCAQPRTAGMAFRFNIVYRCNLWSGSYGGAVRVLTSNITIDNNIIFGNFPSGVNLSAGGLELGAPSNKR